jgi:hypothetical protein
MQEILDRIQSKNAERSILIDQLRMWAEVKAQGIDPETVESFGWKTNLVPANIMEQAASRHHKGKFPWYGEWLRKSGRPLWYNYLNMKDGSVKQLSPYIQAPPV